MKRPGLTCFVAPLIEVIVRLIDVDSLFYKLCVELGL